MRKLLLLIALAATASQAASTGLGDSQRAGRRPWTRDLVLGEPASPGVVLDRVTPDKVAGAGQRPLRYRFHFSPLAPD